MAKKKFVIVGLVLLAVGVALLGWVLLQQRGEKLQENKQRERFNATLNKVNELVANKINACDIEGIATEQIDQQDNHKMPEETKGLILTTSGMLTLTGGTILGWCLLLGTVRLSIRGTSRLAEYWAHYSKSLKGDISKGSDNPEKDSEILLNSGWRNFCNSQTNLPEPAPLQINSSIESESSAQGDQATGTQQRSKGLFARKISGDAEGSNPSAGAGGPAVALLDEEPSKVKAQESYTKAGLQDSGKKALKTQDSLKAQTMVLERRVADFKQTAAHQTTVTQSRHLESSLNELTQQMSAIREYASHQQERVKKLQDGYDWSIIKNFCLRIIRCIDHIEDRTSQLGKKNSDTTNLEEIRDELLFALESNGVEPFEPEINSDYRGQEKNTEAVKEKQHCDDHKLAGKIAQVIRKGYRYLLDDENFKVVRTTQVRLYG